MNDKLQIQPLEKEAWKKLGIPLRDANISQSLIRK